MITPLEWIVSGFILITSIIDWKFKSIPSILLTTMLFFVAFLNPANLWFGIMTFIIAYLLYEFDFFSGVADIKIMTMIGFMLSTTNNFFIFLILTVVFGFIWKVLIKWRLKNEKHVAFIPVFLFIFITLLILGGV